MPQCPSCQNTIEDDFGFVSCSHCGQVVSVDMDGEVLIPSEETNHGGEEPQDFNSNEGISSILTKELLNEQSMDSGESDVMQTALSIDREPTLAGEEDLMGDSLQSTVEVMDSEEPLRPESISLSSDSVSGLHESAEFSNSLDMEKHSEETIDSEILVDSNRLSETSLSEEEALQPISEEQGNSEILEENKNEFNLESISEYGNSEVSNAVDGTLVYDVIIEGIDTLDLKAELRDYLFDPKFMWDVDQLLGNIKDGKLVLVSLSAVKVALLVGQIKALPFEVTWKQKLIVEPY